MLLSELKLLLLDILLKFFIEVLELFDLNLHSIKSNHFLLILMVNFLYVLILLFQILILFSQIFIVSQEALLFNVELT